MYRKILVPLDGSATSARGLEEAVALARASGASLALLHVVDAFPFTMDMTGAGAWDALVDGLRQQGRSLLEQAGETALAHGVKAAGKLVEFPSGRVADVIVDEVGAQGCDLVVMGTHGRRGFGHLMLGSDAERVLHLSPVPVLLIRHPESGR